MNWNMTDDKTVAMRVISKNQEISENKNKEVLLEKLVVSG